MVQISGDSTGLPRVYSDRGYLEYRVYHGRDGECVNCVGCIGVIVAALK